jgi:uncharacterized membrane protein
MTNLLQVFLLSMTPIGELRLSIPMGILVFQLSAFSVFFVSIIGNLVPAIFLLFFLKKISSYLSKKSIFFQKIFSWWENNAKKKHLDGVQKLGLVGLFLFVAIPLPLTGAWTGSLLATIMNLPIKKSLPSIFFGIVTAGMIVTFTIIFGINIERYLGWQILIGLVIISVLAYLYFKKLKK